MLTASMPIGPKPEGKAHGVIDVRFPDSGLRAREVISRSRTRPTGKYPGVKAQRMMHWESVHELHAFRLLDCAPEVKSFSEQPCEVQYEVAGVRHRHYPDVLVRYRDRVELWEIKTPKDAQDPEVAARTELLASKLPEWGYEYRLILADELARQPRLNNASVLLRFGRGAVSPVDRELVRRTLKEVPGITWRDASSGAVGPQGRGTLCSLTLEGALYVDMDSPIIDSTVFRLREGRL